MTTTLTISLIVRNEAKTLGRCLDSVRGLGDEIVVVDTGSTEGTREIAADHGARVFEFPWKNKGVRTLFEILGLGPDTNPYRYVINSPTNTTDPMGMAPSRPVPIRRPIRWQPDPNPPTGVVPPNLDPPPQIERVHPPSEDPFAQRYAEPWRTQPEGTLIESNPAGVIDSTYHAIGRTRWGTWGFVIITEPQTGGTRLGTGALGGLFGQRGTVGFDGIFIGPGGRIVFPVISPDHREE